MSSIEPASEYIIRPARLDDGAQVQALFAVAFGKSNSEASWRWKLWQHTTPLQNVWVAVSGGTVIGHYAGTPLRFWHNGQAITAMVSVDGMVHPDHRRQGVLTSMVTACHAHWVEHEVAFTLGLPNEQWRSRKQALGWQSLFPLAWQIMPLRLEALAAGRLGLPPLGRFRLLSQSWHGFWRVGRKLDDSVYWEPLDQRLDEIDHLWQTIQPRLNLSVLRTGEWIAWRYLTAPHYTYRVMLARRGEQTIGYMAYRLQATNRYGPVAYLAELVCDPTDARLTATLVAHAVHHLASEGAVAALTLAIPGTRLHTTLRQAGFRFSFGAFDTCITPLCLEPVPTDFFVPSHWSLCGGDFDVI
jgi:predicted N-acetyltransferase YhbS